MCLCLRRLLRPSDAGYLSLQAPMEFGLPVQAGEQVRLQCMLGSGSCAPSQRPLDCEGHCCSVHCLGRGPFRPHGIPWSVKGTAKVRTVCKGVLFALTVPHACERYSPEGCRIVNTEHSTCVQLL